MENSIEIQDAAYDMEYAYRKTLTKEKAIEFVQKKNPNINSSMLHSMWAAIDAYIDINVCGE
jgi:hypothetical protein